MKVFNDLTSNNIKISPCGNDFKIAQTIRTGLTHEGSIALDYSTTNSKYIIKGRGVEEVFSNAFNQALMWVDEVYTAMMKNFLAQ